MKSFLKSYLKQLGVVFAEDVKPVKKTALEHVVDSEIRKGRRLVWALPTTPKPIHGLPPGTSKLVMVEADWATLVSMGEKSDKTYLLEDRGEFWVLAAEIKREVIV